ncbi:barstar family protein [Rhodococcus opacus]|uniref:barstar family protein n=1 Tax=Rhodococcus opacus TaxID=37919 RepID=UPI0024742331|nr:barstar family protein [Rhodococcus opacus]MDH6285875.1 hypothetical protein [Rhodococcus opacus]
MGAPNEVDSSFWDRLDEKLSRPALQGTAPSPGVADPRFPWLRIYDGGPTLRSAVTAIAEDPGQPPTHSVLIQGKRCQSLLEFCNTWGDALEFPRYYGRNIDAFEECFRDLLNISEGGIGSQFRDRPGRQVERLVVAVADADLVLQDEDLIGPERIVEIIDWLRSHVDSPRCDLKIVYSPSHDVSRDALRKQIGMTSAPAERAKYLEHRIEILEARIAALERRSELFDTVDRTIGNAETHAAVQDLLRTSPTGTDAVLSMPVTSFNTSHQRAYRRLLDELRSEHTKAQALTE